MTAPQAVYHVSEDPAIRQFTPRPVRPDHPLGITEPVVWAIGGRLLHNYLLPRDCPRVCYHAGPQTTAADCERFLGDSAAPFVVAIEWGWLERARAARLICYELPAEGFQLVDPVADYWVCAQPVIPSTASVIDNPLAALAARHVELRLCPSLWPLCDAVAASTLCFSAIRMGNAQPRQVPPRAKLGYTA